MKTEKLIKLLLTLLHKAIMRWYKEHPEGATQSHYYGSAYFVVNDDKRISARLTLQSGEGHYTDIVAPVHDKEARL